MWTEPGREFRVASEKWRRLHFVFEGFRDTGRPIIQKLQLLLGRRLSLVASSTNTFDLPCPQEFHLVRCRLRMGETATWCQKTGSLMEAVWVSLLAWEFQSDSSQWPTVSSVGYFHR